MKNLLLVFFGITTLLIVVTAQNQKIWTPFFIVSAFYMMYIGVERFIIYLKQKNSPAGSIKIKETNGDE